MTTNASAALPAPSFWGDVTPSHVANAVIGFLFAASGPLAIILATGTRGGLSEAEIASWVFGSLAINGALSIGFCLVWRQPLVFFWTIPGTVLIGPALQHFTFPAGDRRVHRHRRADAGAGRARPRPARHGADSAADRDGHGGRRIPAVRPRLGARVPCRSRDCRRDDGRVHSGERRPFAVRRACRRCWSRWLRARW